ncbi:MULTISPECIES: AIPR family protein [unclassified Frankia]
METLLKTPENFWYYNNGVTVLCDGLTFNRCM